MSSVIGVEERSRTGILRTVAEHSRLQLLAVYRLKIANSKHSPVDGGT
jgi:hypothetical protein